MPSLQQVYWQRDYMTVMKDAKKFAKKHPGVAVLVVFAGAYTIANTFFSSYVVTSAFQRSNQ